MLENLKLEDVLFLDIETVPLVYNYSDLDERMRKLWDARCRSQQDPPDVQYKKAGIYAEFAKIVCISVGYLKDKTFRLKSFCGHDERILLQGFTAMLNKYYSRENHVLCGHNAKEFDFPFIARRMLLNGLKLPSILNIQGKKPWEVKFLDTMELWKFGDYKNYTSLSLLAAIFNIPTPKDDIDGSEVSRVYWEEKDLQRIAVYCQKDVLTLVQLLLRFRGEPLIPEEDVVIAEDMLPQQPLRPRTLPSASSSEDEQEGRQQLSIFI